MRRRSFPIGLMVAAFLLLPGLASSQAKQENPTLAISGRPGAAKVVEIGGHSYVEVDALARLVNGSLRFNGDQIVLMIPASAGGASAAQPKPPAFSKDFLRASVEAMAAIREWQSGLASDVQHGYPLPDDWMSNSRMQASKDVSLASVAASTDNDRSAMRLLSAEFNDMEQLSGSILATSKAQEYIPRDTMSKDRLNDRILNCAHSLASIIASEKFVDDGTCY